MWKSSRLGSNKKSEENGAMKRKVVRAVVALGAAFFLAGISACSSGDSLAGTWERSDGATEIAFYDDGSCLDLPITGRTGADAESWKLHDDGKLVIKMEWDGDTVIERTDQKEEALEDKDYFYLSGDELVFWKDEYKRND